MEIEDDNLDHFFRKKTLSEGDEPGFDEDAWALMERKLNKRDRVIFFKRTSAVLLLLCGFGLGAYFLNNGFSIDENNQISKNQKTNLNKEKNSALIAQKDSEEIVSKKASKNGVKQDINSISKAPIKNIQQENTSNNSSSSFETDYQKENIALKAITKNGYENLNPINNIKNESVFSSLGNDSVLEEISDLELEKEEIIKVESKELVFASNEPEIKSILFEQSLTKKEKIKTPSVKGKGIDWGLSFSLGPENNTVNGFGTGKTTINGGALIQASFKEKWTLSSGFTYGIKNYNANAQQYTFQRTPRYQIDNIIASCDVLEIPLAVSYQIANQKKGSFYLNAGLSSFLMIKEQYTYQYNPSTLQPDRIIIKNNANQHLLSVLELSTTYQFKLKGKSNLGISPYVKLPLGGVGEGEVNLKSTGINLNYHYDLVKKKK